MFRSLLFMVIYVLLLNVCVCVIVCVCACVCVCGAPGAGSLRAKFELSSGPSTPATLAVQFMNEGSTLSGVDMELQGPGYRLSLTKKRFATGTYGRPLPLLKVKEKNRKNI